MPMTMSLEDYLDQKVFAGSKTMTIMANEAEVKGFDEYIENYKRLLNVEKKALEAFDA